MITEKNIFEQGMLINLKGGSYDGRKKMSKEQLKDLPKEIVRGVHDLFDADFKTLLRAADNVVSTARDMIKRVSVPFPIDGIYFLKADKIDGVIEYLETKKAERLKIVGNIIDNYDAAIVTFAEKYPDYYKAAKGHYPTKERLENRFFFDYQFVKVSAPDKGDSVISSTQYKKEVAKFKDTITEMKQEVAATIYQTLLETTSRLKKQCADNKINQLTLNSLNAFIEKIDDVYTDFIDRDDMKKVIKAVRAQILGVDAESLRGDKDFKKKFGEEIANLAAEIKALPDIPLKRAIEF